MILGGPKDTITSIWTKSLKALVPPKSLGPPPMGGVGVDFKDRAYSTTVQKMDRRSPVDMGVLSQDIRKLLHHRTAAQAGGTRAV